MRAERAHLHEEGAVHMSHGYTSAKMATLPCAAPTVWRALEAHRRMMAAETVLVLGTGGVKVFALQITTMFDRREAGQVPLQPRALLRVYAMAMPQSSKA